MIGSKGQAYKQYLKDTFDNNLDFDAYSSAPHRYLTTPDYARLLFYHHIYQQILNVQGEIHLHGVSNGSTLFILAHLAEIFESLNSTRQIVGFDLFEDHQAVYPHVSTEDGNYCHPDTNPMPHCTSFDALQDHVDHFNGAARTSVSPRIKLVKGDSLNTYQDYCVDNYPVISLLLLHIETYKVEKSILKTAWSKMPRGAIVVSSALGSPSAPGVAQLFDDVLGISNIKIVRTDLTTKMCYLIKD